MSLSLYAVTVKPMRLTLKNLSAVIAKAEAHCEARKIDPAVFVNGRLYPDMLPLTAQIQRASDTSRFVAVRVGQVEPRPMADEEKTFADMQADLDRERRTTMRLWAKREAQLNAVISASANFYGDLQGIAGQSIPELESLSPLMIAEVTGRPRPRLTAR